MNMESCERRNCQQDLRKILLEIEEKRKKGVKDIPARQVVKEFRDKLN